MIEISDWEPGLRAAASDKMTFSNIKAENWDNWCFSVAKMPLDQTPQVDRISSLRNANSGKS